MEVIYKEVPNTNGRYYATNDGRIWDNERQIFIAQQKNKRGWMRCHIWKNGKRITTGVHRIIMAAFYGESELTVNHIDGNKENNNIENLEYMTVAEQNKHRSYILKAGNRVSIRCLENGKTYETEKEACDDLGLDYGNNHISAVINHKYGFRSSHGYHFEKV